MERRRGGQQAAVPTSVLRQPERGKWPAADAAVLDSAHDELLPSIRVRARRPAGLATAVYAASRACTWWLEICRAYGGRTTRASTWPQLSTACQPEALAGRAFVRTQRFAPG